MKLESLLWTTTTLLIAVGSDLGQLAKANSQKISLSVAKASMTRTISERADENSSVTSTAIPYDVSMGLAASYELFLKKSLAFTTLFEMGLGGLETSVVLLGGAGGVTWYAVGGRSDSFEDSNIISESKSKFNVMLFAGLGGYSYNFKPFEEAQPKSGKVAIVSAQRSTTESSIIGLQLGFGADYPIGESFAVGFRYNIFNGFASSDKPKVDFTSMWIMSSFAI
jgi:hypothetical protein